MLVSRIGILYTRQLTCVWNKSILDGLGYDGPVEWYISLDVSSFPEK